MAGRNAFLSGDWRQARKYYKAAVKSGSISAVHNLGVMLLHGQGCLVDFERAREYFQEASIYGICESMNQLGYMHYYGKGCPQDYALARGWFLSSDMHGSHPYAQYHLGIMHAMGQGVVQDWKEAAKWLRLSADQGYSPAIYNLGVLYFNGDGVPQSYDVALDLYARAAAKGHAASNNNFAIMCAEGLGSMKHSVEEVMVFWEHAAAKNVSEAHYNLVNIHLERDVVTLPPANINTRQSSAPVIPKRCSSVKSKRPTNPVTRTIVSDTDTRFRADSTSSAASSAVHTAVHTVTNSIEQKSLPPRLSRANLPPLKPRESSRRVEILAPPSPFFKEVEMDKTSPIYSRALPRSPTEPNMRVIESNLPRSASLLQMKPLPPVHRSLPTPDQSPLVKVRAKATPEKRKRHIPLAKLASTMPATPEGVR